MSKDLDKLQNKVAGHLGGNVGFPVYIPPKSNNIPSININDLSAYAGQDTFSNWEHSIYDGAKFPGGFGLTQVQEVDYWTLRARSATFFNQNLYARAIIRRLVTNEINTGLTPESMPDEAILQFGEGELNDWTEITESRFSLWANNPLLCDFKQRMTFGAIQRIARSEALVVGDILVVMRQSAATKLPTVQLVNGNRVQTPIFDSAASNIPKSHTIKHGVQFDGNNRVVAHWIRQDDGSFKRLPAFGEKSGRRISWLVYGTDKRIDDVRGQPLLSLVLQSIQDIDSYRDSTNRRALLSSFFAASVEKENDKPGTLPLQGAAIRNDQVNVNDSDGKTRSLNISKHIPGIFIEEMQTGEKLKFHNGEGTDLNFGTFEDTITAAIAWANEIPPEILRLAFSNNYSASQAAINEFKIYLNKIWSDWGQTFCTPIYIEWLIAESLLGKNKNAAAILQSWRNNREYDIFTAWISVEWYGSIKPSTDMLKQAKGSELLTKNSWSTNAREARVNTGTKFSRNVKRVKRENEQLVESWRPILKLRAEFGDSAVDNLMNESTAQATDNVLQVVTDSIGEVE